MPITLSTRDAGFEAGFQALLGAKRESAADVDAAVAAIVDNVAARGDTALIDYTRQFDRFELTPAGLRLTAGEIAAGADAAPAETVAALRFAAGPRRWRPWPTAPRRSPRSTRSSAPATPMSRPPSGGSSAGSAST